ncbi:hypothetical protein EZV62_014540 [Acer yangbiense]|uniref:RRM domain-containing protein n=1 Tax=Acer yangbiense TaxID=1000413 RepID=A0A5C7HSB6_9ROSI|nr:hypothetical protein EZV62_014540 [Acer yangbiense]
MFNLSLLSASLFSSSLEKPYLGFGFIGWYILDMESSEAVKKLFVGGLPKEANEETLKDHFQEFGEVEESLVIRDRSTGNGRGFGFVTFTESTMADKALRFGHQHGHLMLGKKVFILFIFLFFIYLLFPASCMKFVDVKRALPRLSTGYISNGNGNNQTWTTNKIFVGGLPDELTNEEFRSYFEDFGTVTDAVVIFEKYTCRPRGFGFITFDSHDVAQKVLDQSSYELKNKKVHVKRAEPKEVNDKYMSVYDVYNTDLVYGLSSCNTYPPFLTYMGYPSTFPTVQHYDNWNLSGCYPNYGWDWASSNMNGSSTSRGYVNPSVSVQANGRAVTITAAKLQIIDDSQTEVDDSSSLKSSVAEPQTEIDVEPQMVEIEESSSPKSVIDDELSSPERNASEMNGFCSNHAMDKQ